MRRGATFEGLVIVYIWLKSLSVHLPQLHTDTMDTIKKKMMAMRCEKDAALERAEALEQSLKDIEEGKSEVRCLFHLCRSGPQYQKKA